MDGWVSGRMHGHTDTGCTDARTSGRMDGHMDTGCTDARTSGQTDGHMDTGCTDARMHGQSGWMDRHNWVNSKTLEMGGRRQSRGPVKTGRVCKKMALAKNLTDASEQNRSRKRNRKWYWPNTWTIKQIEKWVG
jgi:hypothetical protein